MGQHCREYMYRRITPFTQLYQHQHCYRDGERDLPKANASAPIQRNTFSNIQDMFLAKNIQHIKDDVKEIIILKQI